MRSALIALVLAFLAAPMASQSQNTGGPQWTLVVLGIAQDGGIPHIGCTTGVCADIRAGRRKAEKVASLGLIERGTGEAYLFDATPDLPAQLQRLTGGEEPNGIFLTHAHIGHYTGLMYLGREAMAARHVNVYGSERMLTFLRTNGPWNLLVQHGHIALGTVPIDTRVTLAAGLHVTGFKVPHRDELSDTIGYLIQGPRASAIYVPDTDRWETWPRSIRELAAKADLLFLDGTFASPSELPGRDITEIPHPMMSATRQLLRGTSAKLWFIHLNHTNKELEAADVVREGMEFPL
jgi:pyrroloquinoline quinone biosynthesis protein B